MLAAVWKTATLGFAFMEGTKLRFGQLSDAAPDFRQLQALKFQLKPDIIVIPSASDAGWAEALSTSCLLLPGVNLIEEHARENGSMGHRSDHGDISGTRVVAQKSRDFDATAITKRLSMLRTLVDLPDADMSCREALHVEHTVPREQEHARRAISGLLAYMQRSFVETVGIPLAVTALRRFSLDSQLYMSPDTFLSLGVFSDHVHPSAHGGRPKEGSSLWSLFNRCKVCDPSGRLDHTAAHAADGRFCSDTPSTNFMRNIALHPVESWRAHSPAVVCATHTRSCNAPRTAQCHRHSFQA